MTVPEVPNGRDQSLGFREKGRVNNFCFFLKFFSPLIPLLSRITKTAFQFQKKYFQAMKNPQENKVLLKEFVQLDKNLPTGCQRGVGWGGAFQGKKSFRQAAFVQLQSSVCVKGEEMQGAVAIPDPAGRMWLVIDPH